MTNNEISQSIRVTTGIALIVTNRLIDSARQAVVDNGSEINAIVAARHLTIVAFNLTAALDAHKNDFPFNHLLTNAIEALNEANLHAAFTNVTAISSDNHKATDDISVMIGTLTDVRAAL
jgi:hypothetical protein